MSKVRKSLLTIALALLPVTTWGASPNVITIIVDDLGYADLSCTGLAEDVDTPNIDQLAKQGVRFTNTYATAPICNASRISLITGCYQQRQGQYWYVGPGLHDPEFPTIAEVLQKQGYTTGYIGKFHYGAKDKPGKRGYPMDHGFEYFFGCSGGTKHYLHHAKRYLKKKDQLYEGPMWEQNEEVDIEGFSTEIYGEKSREFIKDNKDKPFYLQLSFNAVHNFTHQLPPEYLKEKGLKGFPDLKDGESYSKWRKKITYPAHAEGRDYYLGQLHFLDLEIGRLIKELKDQEIADNTVIIFVSDNGGSLATYANNGQLKGGKYTLFEGGTRVPMIISYPAKVKTGKVSEVMTSTMDLFPTICRLTGATIPEDLDGIDLMPVLSGKSDSVHRDVLFWDTKAQKAVRKGKWKLLVTNKTPNSELQITPTPKGEFLFDLAADPSESKSVIDQNPEVVNELKKALQEWSKNL